MDVARACKRLRPEMSNKTEFESKENIFLRLSKFKSQMQRLQLKIIYSTRYSDTEFEYRYVPTMIPFTLEPLSKLLLALFYYITRWQLSSESGKYNLS